MYYDCYGKTGKYIIITRLIMLQVCVEVDVPVIMPNDHVPWPVANGMCQWAKMFVHGLLPRSVGFEAHLEHLHHATHRATPGSIRMLPTTRECYVVGIVTGLSTTTQAGALVVVFFKTISSKIFTTWHSDCS